MEMWGVATYNIVSLCYGDVHQVHDVTKGYINGLLISVFHVMNIQLKLYLFVFAVIKLMLHKSTGLRGKAASSLQNLRQNLMLWVKVQLEEGTQRGQSLRQLSSRVVNVMCALPHSWHL